MNKSLLDCVKEHEDVIESHLWAKAVSDITNEGYEFSEMESIDIKEVMKSHEPSSDKYTYFSVKVEVNISVEEYAGEDLWLQKEDTVMIPYILKCKTIKEEFSISDFKILD